MKVEGTFLNINICNFKAHYVVCVQFTGFISTCIYPGGTVHYGGIIYCALYPVARPLPSQRPTASAVHSSPAQPPG